MMPVFKCNFTYGGEIRATKLRKSNPQGWLLQAVHAVYPEIAARHSGAIMRLRLEKVETGEEAWHAVFRDEPHDLQIRVVKTKS